jgi:ribosomal-protein-serine acetyltransferase
MEKMAPAIWYPALHFEDYLIRPATIADAGQLLHLIKSNADRISDYFPGLLRYTTSLDTLSAHLQERIDAAPEGRYVIAVIEHVESKNLIGLIQLKDIDWNAKKREIGFFIDRLYARKGIMSRALALVIRHSFDELRLNKIFMRTAEKNVFTRKMAANLGFKEEGILRSDFTTTSGEKIDTVYYGILAEEIGKK